MEGVRRDKMSKRMERKERRVVQREKRKKGEKD